ncbi:MAG: DUF3012 domain-containing protein [Mariprofundus sp.]|nr:DUF3012 domain-containing protein [Mariprofundus sp.]
MKKLLVTIFTLLIAFSFFGCSAEPGTKAWCDAMKQKPKGEWTADNAGIFTKHCVLGNYKE